MKVLQAFCLFSLFLFFNCSTQRTSPFPDSNEPVSWEIEILTAGNSWVANAPMASQKLISDQGITNWTDPTHQIRTYFRMQETGSLQLGIRARVLEGESRINCTFGDQRKEIILQNRDWEIIPIGRFDLSNSSSYHSLELQGIDHTQGSFGEVEAVLLGGSALQGQVHFIKDEFYWGRRGPSVHLWYEVPQVVNVRE